MSNHSSEDDKNVKVRTFHLPVQLTQTAIENMLKRMEICPDGVAPAPIELESKAPVERALDKANDLLDLAKTRAKWKKADLFADPAWHMLLDLFVRQHQGLQTSVSSACLASFAPGTTALRYLAEMTDRKMLVRQNDPDDQRKVYLVLADEVVADMIKMLGT